MNLEDVDMLEAERDADPERWQSVDPRNQFQPHYDQFHSGNAQQEATEDAIEESDASEGRETRAVRPSQRVGRVEDLERVETQASVSGSSVSSARPPTRTATRGQHAVQDLHEDGARHDGLHRPDILLRSPE